MCKIGAEYALFSHSDSLANKWKRQTPFVLVHFISPSWLTYLRLNFQTENVSRNKKQKCSMNSVRWTQLENSFCHVYMKMNVFNGDEEHFSRFVAYDVPNWCTHSLFLLEHYLLCLFGKHLKWIILLNANGTAVNRDSINIERSIEYIEIRLAKWFVDITKFWIEFWQRLIKQTLSNCPVFSKSSFVTSLIVFKLCRTQLRRMFQFNWISLKHIFSRASIVI